MPGKTVRSIMFYLALVMSYSPTKLQRDQRGCRFSIAGGPRAWTWQPALGHPALSRGLEKTASGGDCQPHQFGDPGIIHHPGSNSIWRASLPGTLEWFRSAPSQEGNSVILLVWVNSASELSPTQPLAHPSPGRTGWRKCENTWVGIKTV